MLKQVLLAAKQLRSNFYLPVMIFTGELSQGELYRRDFQELGLSYAHFFQ